MAKKKIVAVEKVPAVKGLLRDVPPTVYLNGVLRFDDDHIIRVKYDPDSKAMVIDDVPQSLESSITLGEGGGGSLNNPILTISCHAATAGAAYYVYKIVDGTMTISPDYVDSNQTKDVETVVFYNADYQDYRYYAEDGMPNTSASDMVNCTYSGGEVIVTDPTLPASITLTGSDDNDGDN